MLPIPIRLKQHHHFSWVHIFTVLSFPSAPDAIMFWVGWHATDITVSVWPSNFWTIFLLWSSHKYTQLSSEPLTMYFPFVIENVEGMQYFEFTCPAYVFRNFPVEKFQSLCMSKWNHIRLGNKIMNYEGTAKMQKACNLCLSEKSQCYLDFPAVSLV